MGIPFLPEVIFRSLLAVLIGGLIGSERARHGRAAGMRTHILVCIGGALTAMTSLFVLQELDCSGDVFRIPAQVISGIGFLGAGMIILKSNNVITGLTTAAGVWTTAAIGIAVGYGFYAGAITVTVLFLVSIILFAKFERRKKATEVIYVEIDDMHQANQVLRHLKQRLNTPLNHQFAAPKSQFPGHLGITLIIENRLELDIETLLDIDHVVFIEEE